MIFVLPVVLSGAIAGRRAGIIGSILAVAAFDFFFVPPFYSFTVVDLRFIPTFLVLFIVGAISSFLADLIRIEADKARGRERFVSALYDLSKDLLTSRNRKEFLDKSTRYLAQALDAAVVLLTPAEGGGLAIAATAGDVSEFSAHDFGVAIWVFEHDQRAGRGTGTLASSAWHYVPMRFKDRMLGVLGVAGADLSLQRQQLVESWTNVVSMGLLHYVQSAPAKTTTL
jgi:two-component system sensor histidine kinase KdpD